MSQDRRSRFLQAWFDRADQPRLVGDFAIGAVYQLGVVGFTFYLGVADSAARYAWQWAIVATVLNVVGLVLNLRGKTRIARHLLNGISTGTCSSMLLVCFLYRVEHAPFHMMIAMQAFTMVITAFSIVISYFRGREIIIPSVCCLGLFGACVTVPYGDPFIDTWLVGFPAFIIGAVVYRLTFARVEARAGYAEFERLSQIAPPAIVDHVIASGDGEIGAAFAPTERTCVCICSDWRSYQSMTSGLSAPEVVSALENYYRGTDLLLDQCFPRGNYFSDWIADELFVVAFSLTPGDEAELVREAVAFGMALVEERPRIAAKTKVPRAIDVGIALGVAAVGIMGPERHRKATALGETPGKSRRLQTAAKILREAHGDCDRVVVDGRIAGMLDAAFGVKSHALGDDAKIKDLDERSLLYLEPHQHATKRAAA